MKKARRHDLYEPGPEGMLKIDLPHVPIVMNANDKFFSIGSCLARNIHHIFKSHGVASYHETLTNKHFSAESMANLVEHIASGADLSEDRIFAFTDKLGGYLPYQYHFHERMLSLDALRERVEKLNRDFVGSLREASHVILTLGIANVIRLRKSGLCINRAGGIPFEDFNHSRNSLEEVETHLARTIAGINMIRRGEPTKYIVTISPQRYLFHRQGSLDRSTSRDIGRLVDSPHVENAISKATLRLAVERFLLGNPGLDMYYFPSYEIVLDELRSFEPFLSRSRSYIHGPTAAYVAERFFATYFSAGLARQMELLPRVEHVRKIAEVYGGGGHEYIKDELDDVLRETSESSEEFSNLNPLLLHHLLNILAIYGLQDVLDDILLRYLDGSKRIACWGIGGNFESTLGPFLRRHSSRFELTLIDNDATKRDAELLGARIEPPVALEGKDIDVLFVTSTYRDSILDAVGGLGGRVRQCV